MPISPSIALAFSSALSAFCLATLSELLHYNLLTKSIEFAGAKFDLAHNFGGNMLMYSIVACLVNFAFIRPLYGYLIQCYKRAYSSYFLGAFIGGFPTFLFWLFTIKVNGAQFALLSLELLFFSLTTSLVFWGLCGRYRQSAYFYDNSLNPLGLVEGSAKLEITPTCQPFAVNESYDEIAKKCDWQALPFEQGGDITTHRFVIAHDAELALRPVRKLSAWSMLCFGFALIALVFGEQALSERIFIACFLVFVGILALSSNRHRSITLSHRSGTLVIKRKKLFKHQVQTWPLENIYALQLVKGQTTIFTDEDVHRMDLVQLIIVFEDGSRELLNVYGDPSTARKDAKLIAFFLENKLAVWDVIDAA